MKRKAPAFLKKYFWDIDFAKLNPDKSPVYVIERLLEIGDDRTIRWLLATFNVNLVREVVMTSRVLSPETASFWSTILKIEKRRIACLQAPSLKVRQSHWPY